MLFAQLEARAVHAVPVELSLLAVHLARGPRSGSRWPRREVTPVARSPLLLQPQSDAGRLRDQRGIASSLQKEKTRISLSKLTPQSPCF